MSVIWRTISRHSSDPTLVRPGHPQFASATRLFNAVSQNNVQAARSVLTQNPGLVGVYVNVVLLAYFRNCFHAKLLFSCENFAENLCCVDMPWEKTPLLFPFEYLYVVLWRRNTCTSTN